jgi:hypothetical protein
MELLIAVLIAVAVIAALLTDRMPRLYLQRACQGFAWRRQFPQARKESIRAFLHIFTAAFSFKRQSFLKFSPDDELMQIYRALYPSVQTPDALELEALSQTLAKEYGVNLQAVWHEHLTLGELFSIAVPRSFNSEVHPKP